MSNWTEADLLAHQQKAMPLKRLVNKYGVAALPERAFDGIVYDSKRECTHARSLDALMKLGRITKIERQVPFDLKVNEIKICRIVIDFRVTWHTGQVVLQEVKGYATKDWKIKRKLFQALYPDLEYEVIT